MADNALSSAVSTEFFRLLGCHYRVPHVRFVVRSRALCQAVGGVGVGSGSVVLWLLRNAPLWVVVGVCELLRKR